ncbi:hypothetical protein [Aquiflexum sp.]
MKAICLSLLLFVCFSSVFAQESEKPIPNPVIFETTHQGTFHGKSISY